MGELHLLCTILSLPAVNLIGVEFICPTFRDGQNIVSCKINKTAVEAADCESMQEHMTLEKTTPSRRNPLPIGSTESFNTSNCKPVQGPVADGCWCNESNRDIFDYKCALMANRSKDVNAELKCKICISPKSALEVKVHENCKPMRFGTESQDSGGSLNAALIVGVSVAAVIMVLLGILFYILQRRFSYPHSKVTRLKQQKTAVVCLSCMQAHKIEGPKGAGQFLSTKHACHHEGWQTPSEEPAYYTGSEENSELTQRLWSRWIPHDVGCSCPSPINCCRNK